MAQSRLEQVSVSERCFLKPEGLWTYHVVHTSQDKWSCSKLCTAILQLPAAAVFFHYRFFSELQVR